MVEIEQDQRPILSGNLSIINASTSESKVCIFKLGCSFSHYLR